MSEKQGPAMIEADGLSKYYGDFAAIQDVSFQVRQGEVVAFLGPNGAGKSTTMKLLTGYLAPSAGEARIAGHDMSDDRLAGTSRLGYLPENGPLYPDMSPRNLQPYIQQLLSSSLYLQEPAWFQTMLPLVLSSVHPELLNAQP